LKKLVQFVLLSICLTGLGASSRVTPVSIKVLNFNIGHGEDSFGESNLRTVVQLIKEYKPHVVALQGVDSVRLAGKLRFHMRQIALQTNMYYLYGASDLVEGGTEGVGLLSVWPFEKTQKMGLPARPGASPRTLICGLVRESERLTFRICNTQLDYTSAMDRGLQSAYVNQFLYESIQPVILAMDMGVKPTEQPYFSFRKNWYDAARGSQVSTRVDGLPGERLDYLFVLEKSRIRVGSYKLIRDFPTASTHYPMLTTIEFL
jgi:endonuclease/exonuclease/phosphatase family metal-dependent hydrolase